MENPIEMDDLFFFSSETSDDFGWDKHGPFLYLSNNDQLAKLHVLCK